MNIDNLLKQGVTPKLKRGGSRVKVSAATKARIIELRLAKVTETKVSDLLGVSATTVQVTMRKYRDEQA